MDTGTIARNGRMLAGKKILARQSSRRINLQRWRDTSYSYRFRYPGAAGSLGEVVAPHVNAAGDRRTILATSGAAGTVRVAAITDFPPPPTAARCASPTTRWGATPR